MKNNIKTIFLLHILLMIYSMSSICSKMAGKQPFLSLSFCLYYGGMILILFIYAIGWQQIIKRMDLTSAFANKSVTVIWGIIWGVLFFQEPVTLGKIIGAVLVICGVVLYSFADSSQKTEISKKAEGENNEQF